MSLEAPSFVVLVWEINIALKGTPMTPWSALILPDHNNVS